MTRLIVEEGGQRRAFQVGEGTLTIGSGAGSALKLTSPGVAELHAELQVKGGKVLLRPKPGVLPPLLEGSQVLKESEVPPGASFTIGEARLWVEAVGAPAAPAAAPVRAPAPAPVRAPAPRRSTSGRPEAVQRSGGRTGATERDAPTGRRARPKANFAPLIVLAGVLGVIGVLFLFRGVFFQRSTVVGPREILVVARGDLEQGLYDQALGRLKAIPPAALNDPRFKKRHDELIADVEAARQEGILLSQNIAGTEFLQTQLQNFEKNYLRTNVDKPKVRVFLQRAQEFKQRWPRHEGVDWVERQEARFRGMVDLSKPADYDDIAFEVKAMTWTDTRNYKEAFRLLEVFMQRASGDQLTKAKSLMEEKKVERAAWYEDRMLQARYEYDNQKIGKSVAILVTILTLSGDPVMADAAAAQLLLFPNLAEWLRGYRSSRPDTFEQMIAHPQIGEYYAANP